jgi:23S rRNA (uracil1939-C5)-methyltransferase
LNVIGGVEWHAGPVEAVLATLDGPFDGAVLDPPRRGCDPAALDHLLRLRPPRIVYVACHPGTLARDCKILREGGYVVAQAEVIDLFPQTHHVESIVVLSSK